MENSMIFVVTSRTFFLVLVDNLTPPYRALMTNSSLAVSSASLTHLIKMSEPVFTSFILAALGRIIINCDLVLIMFSVDIQDNIIHTMSDIIKVLKMSLNYLSNILFVITGWQSLGQLPSTVVDRPGLPRECWWQPDNVRGVGSHGETRLHQPHWVSHPPVPGTQSELRQLRSPR